MERYPFAHENLGPAGDRTDLSQVPRELNAMGNNIRLSAGRLVTKPDRRRHRPKGIGLTEAIEHHLPSLEHFGDPIRSHKTEGHANLALYLRNGLEGPPAEWVQHKATWPKVNDPKQTHAARVTLVKPISGGPTIVVGHGPQAPNPRLPDATNAALREARAEWVDVTVGILRRYPEVIWLGDPNYLLDDVIRELDDEKAVVGGDGTDAVLAIGYTLERTQTASHVNGVPMLTDHHKVLLGTAIPR